MNASRMLIAAAALVLAGAAAHAADKPTKADKPTRAEKNEARLAEMLKGRTAGTPITCIPLYQSNKLEIIEGVAMVYGTGDTIYVAKPTHSDMLRWDDIVVIERTGGSLCYNDIIRTIDRTGGYTTGVVFLEKFVPYKKQN